MLLLLDKTVSCCPAQAVTDSNATAVLCVPAPLTNDSSQANVWCCPAKIYQWQAQRTMATKWMTHLPPPPPPTCHTLWHYGSALKCSLHAASATGGQQALHHSWMHDTPVCNTDEKKKKNATVEVLMVKGKQLLLTFSRGFQPPQRVINLDPVF